MTDGLHVVVRADLGRTVVVGATGRLTAAGVDELLRVVLRTRDLADVPMLVDLTEVEAEPAAAAAVVDRAAVVPGSPVRVRLRAGGRSRVRSTPATAPS
ncbi:hypothetical protein [Cellulomonas sp. Marseille-Q8402]